MTTLEPETPDAGSTAERAVLAEAAEAVDTAAQRVEITPLDYPRRLLLVHAHPDDETIGSGVTMAKYAAEGALVTLVTCTLGEEGEILAPGLEHLAADKEDRLGEHRIGELAEAMRALGVTDHRFLGGPGRWRDSGMMGVPSNDRPDCFWQADLDEAVGELVRIVREVRPQVIVTYDENGGYGHPDHIQAHRVAVAAYDAAGDPARFRETGEPWQVSRLFYTTFPRSFIQAGIDALKEQGETMFEGVESADDLPFARPDEEVDVQVDGSVWFENKMAAMKAHATQISVDGPFFALSNNLGQRAFGLEFYALAKGDRVVGDGPNGWLTDLFAGL